MTHQSAIGKLGEDISCRFIRQKGYRVIERNYRRPLGEIDIIATAPDGTLVIFEVKTVSGPNPQITAEDQMTSAKLDKLKRVASVYAATPRIQNLIRENKGWRIDLLSLTINGKNCVVKHYENVV
jgi:putative endonuclease